MKPSIVGSGSGGSGAIRSRTRRFRIMSSAARCAVR
jgi:hypothetical protein